MSGGFAQIMRDITDGLIERTELEVLIVLMAVVNRVGANLVTDVGAYTLGVRTHFGQEKVDRILEHLVGQGWMRVQVSVDPYRLNPILLKMVAPNVICPVFGDRKGEILRLWNDVFSSDKALVRGYRQRYRNDIQVVHQTEPQMEHQTETQTESQTVSPDQGFFFEREGQKQPPIDYTQAEIEADFRVSDSLAEPHAVGTMPISTAPAGQNSHEERSSPVSEVQSSAALIERVKTTIPELSLDTIRDVIARCGGETAIRVLDMMDAPRKKPIDKPAGYFKSMCTKLSGRASNVVKFDPLSGASYTGDPLDTARRNHQRWLDEQANSKYAGYFKT